MATPKQTDPQFKLRMPLALKEQIEAAAAQNNRSMNAEMVSRLETSFNDSVTLPNALASRVASYANEYGRTLSEEVVRVLEQKFPAPRSPDERFAEVLAILGGLQGGSETNSALATFSVEVLRTLREISSGDMETDPDTRRRVSDALASWEEATAYKGLDEYTANMDPEELEKFERTGDDRIFKEDEK